MAANLFRPVGQKIEHENTKRRNLEYRWFRVFVFSCFIFLLAGTAAWAQYQPPSADTSRWMPAARTRNAYVNPSTGATVPVPPPPPKVGSFDEWTPVKSSLREQRPSVAPEKSAVAQEQALSVPQEFTSITPASLQNQAERDTKAPGEELQEIKIQLEPPGPDMVFKRESEQAFQERLRQLSRQQKTTRFEFPEEPVLSTEKYAGRSFPPANQLIEPNYLCYERLLFEDINSERYGWDLGFIQPFISGGKFLWDMATLPYHATLAPCRHFECNAGYCLPGDPVPYLLYPPELSLTGTFSEAAVIVALFAIFPG